MGKIKIEASVNAPVEKVWEYYTNPKHIVDWNFASPDWHCPWAKNDLQVGGVYTARMESKDGKFGFDFTAKYDEIIDKKKLVYTGEDGRVVVNEFIADGAKTKVTTTFDAESEHPEEYQKAGWLAILHNFKDYVEKH